MPEYRVTFHNGPKGNNSASVDVTASNSTEAQNIAISRHGGANALRAQGFTNVSVMEIAKGAKVIGLVIECQDTYFMSWFNDYVFILAVSEEQAVAYYNEHLKGKRFWFNACKEAQDGKCVRGRVVDSYFAVGPFTAPFDATK